MTNLTKKVQNTVFQNELFKLGDKIILAVSGGPDSVCMLDIFARLKKKYSLKLSIVHVNYGLRGDDSDRDETLVRKLAEKYELDIFVLHPMKKKVGKNPSENFLRDIRYDFFEKIRKEKRFNSIAVAHNADDQVETFLLRIIRGAGLAGLSAMKLQNAHIIRPLLEVSRKEILAYLKENQLRYRIDKTNLETKFLRNKIRNDLIPYLEKEFNPNIKKTILGSVSSVVRDDDFISEATERKIFAIKKINVKDILKLHPALQRRIIRKKLEEKKGDLKNISATNVEEIVKIIKSTKNKRQIVILAGLKITRKGDKIVIEKEKKLRV